MENGEAKRVAKGGGSSGTAVVAAMADKWNSGIARRFLR